MAVADQPLTADPACMQPSQRGNEQRLELAESLSTFGFDVRCFPKWPARQPAHMSLCMSRTCY